MTQSWIRLGYARRCTTIGRHMTRSVVAGGDEGKLMTDDYAIIKVRMQCHYIAKASQIRLDIAPNKLDWRSCCKEAVDAMKMNGAIMANNADTVDLGNLATTAVATATSMAPTAASSA